MTKKTNKCECPITECNYHNKCEECINHHVGKKIPVYCIKQNMKEQ